MEDPLLGGGEVRKSVFLIFFQGDQLKIRVKKICEGFRSTLYPCPEKSYERDHMMVGVMKQLADLNTVITQTNDLRRSVLSEAAKKIKLWFIKVRKIKAVYHTLNLLNLDVSQKCLIAECWIPTLDLGPIS
jgi:V-type H+-transporting ATPase subunit a